MRVAQREIVELSFRFLDGVERIHPALVISTEELQDAEEGMFYAVLISSKNLHPEYTMEIYDTDIIGGSGMSKKSYFVTHFIAYFTHRDVVRRPMQFVKAEKFNRVVDKIIDNIFGEEL